MIKINLIQKRRKTRQSGDGQQTVLAGFGVILVAAAGVFFLVHSPLVDEIEAQGAKNAAIEKENKALAERTKDFRKLEEANRVALEQQAAIERLTDARAVPSWLLYELSTILTRDRQPTMTDAMAKRVREDPNRMWMDGWDPKHLWITSFSENGGRFKLTGSAQSDSDMTQLALRLQASTYFDSVVPEGGGAAAGDGTGAGFYKSTITGKVRY